MNESGSRIYNQQQLADGWSVPQRPKIVLCAEQGQFFPERIVDPDKKGPAILAGVIILSLCGVGGSRYHRPPNNRSEDPLLTSQTSFETFLVTWILAWHINHTLSEERVENGAQSLEPLLRLVETRGVGAARLTGALFKQTSLLLELPLRGLGALFDTLDKHNRALKRSGRAGWLVSRLFWPFIFILRSLTHRLANVVAYTANLIVKIWDTVVDFLRLLTWSFSALFFKTPKFKDVQKGPLTDFINSLSGVVLNILRLAPEAAIVLLYVFFPPAAVLIHSLYALMPGAAAGIAAAALTAATIEAAAAVPAQGYAWLVNKAANQAAIYIHDEFLPISIMTLGTTDISPELIVSDAGRRRENSQSYSTPSTTPTGSRVEGNPGKRIRQITAQRGDNPLATPIDAPPDPEVEKEEEDRGAKP